jgi:anti-sigma factor RsiW
MSGSNLDCSKWDWKGYVLGELDKHERAQAEAHAATCEACRNELASTRLTLDALSTLREEEVPRRIAFVSDKVFEPRWWQQLWSPTFAAACVVAAAILVHGVVAFARPSADPAEIQARVDRAVTKAVADTVERQSEQLQEVLATVEKQNRINYKSVAQFQ